MQRIDITRDFTIPVERVYAYLAQHENLGPLFGASVTRVRDGESTRNGVGSVRRLRIAVLPPFEETVTAAVTNQLIEYRITSGSPLRDHSGRMEFQPLPAGGTRLHYVITFTAVVPGLDKVVKRGLQRQITRGLAGVENNA